MSLTEGRVKLKAKTSFNHLIIIYITFLAFHDLEHQLKS